MSFEVWLSVLNGALRGVVFHNIIVAHNIMTGFLLDDGKY